MWQPARLVWASFQVKQALKCSVQLLPSKKECNFVLMNEDHIKICTLLYVASAHGLKMHYLDHLYPSVCEIITSAACIMPVLSEGTK